MMTSAISSAVLVMCLMVVTCEETQREVEAHGNNLNEQQIQNFQNSLFNIFDRLGSSLNQNRSTTEDKNGNNLYIIKSLVLSNLTFNFNVYTNATEKMHEEKVVDSSTNVNADNSELQERMAKLETLTANLVQNQKSMDDQMNVLNSNFSDFANNTRKLPETVSVNPMDPCKTASASGVFKIQHLHRNVYCEMTTFGGRWMVFQQRAAQQGSFKLSFMRPWAEYKSGFGTVGMDTDHWLGLEVLHKITQSDNYELAIEFKDTNGKYEYVRYTQFRIAGEADKYRLTVGGHSGTAVDLLIPQNNMRFTTPDSDNDNYLKNCAKDYWNGGWWYNTCAYYEFAPNYSDSPNWLYMDGNTKTYKLGAYIRMMVRHK